MKKHVKIGSILLMFTMLATFAAAIEKPAVPQAGAATQFVLGAQDVITASDAGGGYLTTSDILLIVLIVLALIGLGVLL